MKKEKQIFWHLYQENNAINNLIKLPYLGNFAFDLNQAILNPDYTNTLINMLQTSILSTTLNCAQQQSQASQKGTKALNETNINSNFNKSNGKIKQQKRQLQNEKTSLAYKNRKIIISKSSVEQSFYPCSSKQKRSRCYKASETKNVAKNFGKTIISFILKEKDLTSRVLEIDGIDQNQFISYASSLKYKTNSIKGLKSLWVQKENPYTKQIRILSFEFLRKHCLNYLFYSRVRNYSRGLKYRKKILQGIICPQKFTFMKQY